jgi:short-subunit dehydrogenase
MESKSKTHPRALITGASSGIGAAFAERLARDNYELIIVARRVGRLEALAKVLKAKYHAPVEVLAADLSDPDQLKTVEQRITHDSALDMLVNNAGFGGYQPFINLDPNKSDELIRLQVTAVTRLTRAALPLMISSGKGTIINVSSRLAFSGSLTAPSLPKRAVYAGTKAYINTFTQILHSELTGTGVTVQALCPGVVRTEFHERMGMDPSRIPTSMVMKPEDVVEASLAGLRLGEVVCIPALVDPTLLDQVHQSEFKLLEGSGGGTVAERYVSKYA